MRSDGACPERGAALLLTLLVLTILIVLIAQMSVSTVHTKTISENFLNDLQNSYGARSGYHRAALYLEADTEKSPKVDSLGEKWAQGISFTLGAASVKAVVEDSERRVNLSHINKDDGKINKEVADQFRRLVRNLGHPPEVAERIIDYVDTDTQGSYEVGARNERLYTLDELLRIEGLKRENLYGGLVGGARVKGILEFLTIWPREVGEGGKGGSVNINTAPLEILMSLSDNMTPALAEAIVAYRSQQKEDGSVRAFESPNDIKNVAGMTDTLFQEISPRLAVAGSHFEIRVTSTLRNLTKTWLYVVKRSTEKSDGGEETSKIELVRSQKTVDFLAIEPPETKEK